MKLIKWLYPGMRIKRWICLCTLGIIMITSGAVRWASAEFPIKQSGLLLVIGGIGAVILSIEKIIKVFINVLLPKQEEKIVDIIYQKRQLRWGPKIVAIGGGTGLSTLLHGVKKYTENITAIVTVTDTGGSSGRLTKQFNMLPPGDIRNCLVALAETEPLMKNLFNYRFKNGDLSGHSFGNLFIAALTDVTGDFEEAIRKSSEVLAIQGKVVPSTLENVSLIARGKNGRVIEGETNITKANLSIERVFLKPDNCQPTFEAIQAIEDAELIILGPGSLYTSVIPNLLIRKIQEAIKKSKAIKVYVCNVMTQSGETDGYTAFEHLAAIIKHTYPQIVNYCVINSAPVPDELLAKYRQENAYPVVLDTERIRKRGYAVVQGDIIDTSNYVRHNSEKLAALLINLLQRNLI
ncbi:MAG: YvcK family protein [Candidatus Omnitrophica bacterium]|nr:YvcK family protein [Candidatus Omnitrophota bacterium]